MGNAQKGVGGIFIIILLLLGIGLGVYLMGTKTDLFPSASVNSSNAQQIQKLTSQLVNSGKSKESKASLINIAKTRKKLMLQEAQNNPASFSELAVSTATRNSLANYIRDEVEERKSIQGDLIVSQQEDFKTTNSGEYIYELRVDTTKKAGKSQQFQYTKLKFTKDTPPPISKQNVKYEAIVLDHIAFVVSTDQILNKPAGAALTATAPIPSGERKALVLLINFSDYKEQPLTIDQAKNIMFYGSSSVNNYYKENSYGKISFSGDVYGWYTINAKQAECGKYQTWDQLANDQASINGVSIQNYQHIVYVFANQGCLAVGTAQQGLTPSPATINIFSFYDYASIYAHELGHNLGATHADAVTCFTGISNFPNCFFNRYGESPAAVMGNPTSVLPNVFHFNAPSKLMVGFLPASRYQEISNDGTYDISPLESTNGIAVIRIGRRLKTYTYYYLSYRQPIGFDSNLSVEITSGVNIHIISPDQTFGNTTLIDQNPQTNTVEGALQDGQSLFDWANGITIKQLSHDSNKVSVQVSFSAPQLSPPPSTPPSPSPSPSPSLDPNLDSDSDGFTDVYETNLGTNPDRFCALDTSDNAWPPDTSNDGGINGEDVSKMIPYMENNRASSGKMFTKRYDLNLDGKIDPADVEVIKPYFLKSCQ